MEEPKKPTYYGYVDTPVLGGNLEDHDFSAMGSGVSGLVLSLERTRTVEGVAGFTAASAAVAIGMLGDGEWRDLSTIVALSSGAVMFLADLLRRKLEGAMK